MSPRGAEHAWAPGSANFHKGDASVISTQTRTRQAASTRLHSGFLNEGRQRPECVDRFARQRPVLEELP